MTKGCWEMGKGLVGLLALVLLAGCAIELAETPEQREAPREQEAPVVTVPDEPAPHERRSGDALSPAAASLLASARGFLQGGQPDRALSLIQRAHGISPNAAEVYYHFAQAHQARQEYDRAEQFARRGLALAGNREKLERQGAELLAGIRHAATNSQ
ncbi:MAG: hypothetical protein EA349_09890 [Halomonadaceae bacterium]|nr:MAG: hypothetical protein EA349_09890 [Halomonadaceae bacterium]